MSSDTCAVYIDGFSFFGKTSRLISHELKNVLAIMSETLGLMDELMEISGEDVSSKSGKLQSLVASIMEDVKRANFIIKNMNTFAHSVDNFLCEVDLTQIVDLMIHISQYDAVLKTFKIKFQKMNHHIVYSSPFLLGNLIYSAIQFSCAGPSKQEIRISLHSGNDGATITFSGINAKNRQFLTDETESLVKVLSAEINPDTSSGNLKIFIPPKIKNLSPQVLD